MYLVDDIDRLVWSWISVRLSAIVFENTWESGVSCKNYYSFRSVIKEGTSIREAHTFWVCYTPSASIPLEIGITCVLTLNNVDVHRLCLVVKKFLFLPHLSESGKKIDVNVPLRFLFCYLLGVKWFQWICLPHWSKQCHVNCWIIPLQIICLPICSQQLVKFRTNLCDLLWFMNVTRDLILEACRGLKLKDTRFYTDVADKQETAQSLGQDERSAMLTETHQSLEYLLLEPE